MKRVTFVIVGFIAVLILLILTKPDHVNKAKNKKTSIVFYKNNAVNTFD